jgi:hypothetical protein
METPDSGKIINIAMLIGLVLVLFIIYRIMASVGLIKTSSSKANDVKKAAAVTDLRTEQYFDPEYFRSVSSYNGLTVEQANSYATQLRAAMAGFGTDEESIFTLFGKLPSKISISEIANRYKDQYGFPWYTMSDNLQNDLLNELTPSEVETLMSIINKLP